MSKTFADFARGAKVSPGTVSRIVNRNASVHPATEARVRALAAQLGVKLEKAGAPTEGRLLHPALSTVQCFPEEVRRQLADFALRRVANPAMHPQNMTIATHIIGRESCAAPAPRSV